MSAPGKGNVASYATCVCVCTREHTWFYSPLLPPKKCPTGLGLSNSLMQIGNFLKWLNTQQIGKRTTLLKKER